MATLCKRLKTVAKVKPTTTKVTATKTKKEREAPPPNLTSQPNAPRQVKWHNRLSIPPPRQQPKKLLKKPPPQIRPPPLDLRSSPCPKWRIQHPPTCPYNCQRCRSSKQHPSSYKTTCPWRQLTFPPSLTTRRAEASSSTKFSPSCKATVKMERFVGGRGVSVGGWYKQNKSQN